MSYFPKHAVIIAELIACWNTIEDACTLFLPIFTHIDTDQADLMLAHMVSSQMRLDVIRAAGQFALLGDERNLAELNELFDQLEKRLTVRNQYAHGVYVTNGKGELCIARRRYESGTTKNLQVVYLNSLKDEMSHFLKLIGRLRAFLVRLESEMSPELKQALKEIRALRFPLRRTSPA